MLLLLLCIFASMALMFAILKVALRVAWCFAKVLACVLCVIALPLLIILAITAGGAILLLPVLLLAGAFAAIESC